MLKQRNKQKQDVARGGTPTKNLTAAERAKAALNAAAASQAEREKAAAEKAEAERRARKERENHACCGCCHYKDW